MSALSTVRRLKERGGAGGKTTAVRPQKPLTPISEKERSGSCKKSTTGKENSRSRSCTRSPALCQKPVIRPIPIPQIDKPVSQVKDGEPRVRWSTSSVPRGKTSSPSDFSRFLFDFRKDRNSRVSGSDLSVKTLKRNSVGETDLALSNGGKSMNGFRVSQKSLVKQSIRDPKSIVNGGTDNGFRVAGDCKGRTNNSLNSEKKTEKFSIDHRVVEDFKEKACLDSNAKPSEKYLNSVQVLDNGDIEVNLNSNSSKTDKKGVNGALEGCKDNFCIDLDSKVLNEKSKVHVVSKSDDVLKEAASGVGVHKKTMDTAYSVSNSNRAVEKAVSGFKLSENSKEKGATEEDKSVIGIKKYPSKLHEKLAFLEGKVKRIASDIKRTKEMLDMNNPDESKTVLSDIQDKISGIEKAVGHVSNDNNNGNLDMPKIVEDDSQWSNHWERSQNMQVNHLKTSVKGLNHEELEARLFPHHKLIRSRSSLSTSSGNSENHQPEPCGDLKVEDGALSPIDENPIALEFLASLGKNQSKISTKNEHLLLKFHEIQEMDGHVTSSQQDTSNKLVGGTTEGEIRLTCDENLEDFDDQENRPIMTIREETEDLSMEQLYEIGRKNSTGGWFVSEGESVLLAHDDGSCSFHDITNCEEKAEYKPPAGVSQNLWGDCWLIRAPGSDGCSKRYVLAASAGSTLDSGFCSWDFYTKDVQAFHIEDGITASSRAILGPLPNNGVYRRNALSTIMAPENQQWWYKPCGPLIVSTATCQRVVKVYDIRDGEQIMKWEVQKPVLTMDYSSPLHWRNRGKVVIAETETISLWDVNSLNPQALLSVASFGRKISALHVNNTDAELGGGVRQRASSSDVEGNDGVFCTQETINVLDFRLPSGVGLKVSKLGVNVQSVSSRGDSIFLGCTTMRSAAKVQLCSQVQQFSLRKGKLLSTFALPESNAHFHYSAITQVWGNSNLVMGVCGLGLFVFDALKDDPMQSFMVDHGKTQEVREIIGPDDMYSPSFDYLASRALVISRDRPALWRHLL